MRKRNLQSKGIFIFWSICFSLISCNRNQSKSVGISVIHKHSQGVTFVWKNTPQKPYKEHFTSHSLLEIYGNSKNKNFDILLGYENLLSISDTIVIDQYFKEDLVRFDDSLRIKNILIRSYNLPFQKQFEYTLEYYDSLPKLLRTERIKFPTSFGISFHDDIWHDEPIKNILFTNLSSDKVYLYSDEDFNMIFKSTPRYVYCGNAANVLNAYERKAFEKKNRIIYPKINLVGRNLNDNELKVIDTLNLFRKNLADIDRLPFKNIVVKDCQVDDLSSINCLGTNMATIDSVVFRGDSSKLSLINPQPQKVILKLRYVDADKIDFNYAKFHFQYFLPEFYQDNNIWYSNVLEIYDGIIKSQQRLNNQQGIKDASIELAMFKDSQMPMGNWLIILKKWWNNYGFNKGKVIVSSSILFGVIVFINILLFSQLLNIYSIEEIEKAREDALQWTKPLLSIIYRCLLCVVYSGFIFYGIKFDFKALKMGNLLFVFLLILEYVAGVVSLAYIANLIISK